MIQNLRIELIGSHPDNPRKDLGDLTELTESIKANGILQNLTVVASPEPDELYRVIIGHRRLAAAKLAGLTEVPCAVADLTPNQQVGIMLTENMQRSDLTLYEQAHGIQMLLDFGETIGDVAKQTGFSWATIRRRVKLIELDQDKFKKTIERGATLQDYAELDKIQDIDLRNKVLESIGTDSFRWKLDSAIKEEKYAKDKADLIEKVKTFATQVESRNGYKYVRSLNPGQKDFEIPADAGEKKYYFIDEYGITLLEEGTSPTAISELEERNSLIRERREKLSEINKRAYQFRRDFICKFRPKKQHDNAIMEFSIRAFLEDGYSKVDEELFELLGIEPPEHDDDDDEDFMFKDFSEPFYASPERVLLVFAYARMDSSQESFYDYTCRHYRNRTLLSIYTILERLGYPVSDEERAYIDGTHELFVEARRCRICGCTDAKACPGGCSWVETDLCSACVEK